MQVTNMRGALINVFSAFLTVSVIGYAYFQKKQLYPSVVFLNKSNPSMAVLYIQAFIIVIVLTKLMRKLFFGQLRAAELEHLIERSWYAVTETCLAFTVFRDDFSPKFIALFTLLLVLKSFHWLTEDRVDFIERSPVISILFHVRVIALIILLGFLNCYFINLAYLSILTKGATMQLVFGFEYAILFTILVNIFIKYVLHTIDLQNETPWENKAVYLLYTEFVIGLVKVALYIVFLSIMLKIHTFPLFAIRPMYLAMRSLKKSLNDVIMSRRAIRNMNLLYPDATAEELAATDNVCIICREEMTSVTSKKLPCNHIFHASCLRSWFQRQQTCPTCRMNVLRNVPSQTPNNAQPPQAQQQEPQQLGAQQLPNIGGILLGGGFPAQFPMWPHMHQAPQQPAPAANPSAAAQSSTASSTTTTSTTPTAASTNQPTPAVHPSNMPVPPLPPFLPPPFLPIMFPPPPMPPANFSGFSDDEIRRMEGQERENVEARIQSLRNIQILLDAAVLQMQQYSALVSSIRSSQAAAPSSSSQSTSSAMPVNASGSSEATSTSSPDAPSSNSIPSTSQSDSTGTKPKVFCPAPKPFTTNMSSAPSPSSMPTTSSTSSPFGDENPGGGVGLPVSTPADSSITNEVDGEQAEVRRRRLERFSSTTTSRKDNLDLD